MKSTDVQAYSKKDGTQVSEAFRKEHCREVYPGTKTWSESFKDTPLKNWPYKENFKPWTNKEKDRSISYLQNENEFLIVFIDKKENKIKGMQLWLFSPLSLNAEELKKILLSDDWKAEKNTQKESTCSKYGRCKFQ